MRNGFYKIKDIVRWNVIHNEHWGIGEWFEMEKIEGYNGEVGLFDNRVLTPGLNFIRWTGFDTQGDLNCEEYRNPLIVSNYFLDQKRNGFHITYFREGEIEKIGRREAKDILGREMFEEYEEIQDMPIRRPRYRKEKLGEKGKRISAISSALEMNIFDCIESKCIENIPLYLSYTDRVQAEKAMQEYQKNVRRFRMPKSQVFGYL